MNGVSKKFCICVLGINTIIGMSGGVEDKTMYAAMILGIVVVYKVVQAVIDWKN